MSKPENSLVLRQLPQRGAGLAADIWAGVLTSQGVDRASAVLIAKTKINGSAVAVVSAEGRGKRLFGSPPTARIRVAETPGSQPVINASATGRVARVKEAHTPFGMKKLLVEVTMKTVGQVSEARGLFGRVKKRTTVISYDQVNQALRATVDGLAPGCRPTPDVLPAGHVEVRTETAGIPEAGNFLDRHLGSTSSVSFIDTANPDPYAGLSPANKKLYTRVSKF